MSDEPTVNIDPDDMVRYLLYQQFYYGGDRIYGRTKERYEVVHGAGKIIDKFYDLFTKKMYLFNKGKYKKFLNYIDKKIHPIPIDYILNKFKESKEMLNEEMNRKIIMTIIVGETLQHIHKMCFKSSINDLIEYQRRKQDKAPSYIDTLESRVKDLYSTSNPCIGLIHSLSFLKFIGEKLKKKKIIKQCQKLLLKYYEEVIKLIEDGNSATKE